MDVAGNVSIGGTLFAAGGITYDGNVSVSGNLAVGGNVSVGGTLSVTGAASLASTLSVGGASNFLSTVTVAGNTRLGAVVSVVGAANFASTVTVVGATHLQSTVSTAGAATFASTVTVVGAAHLQSTASIGGAATFASTVTVVGATHLKSTVTVGGAATFASTVTVVGATHLQAAVSVGGATQLSNTLTVGVNDTGYDVKFFGAASGSYMLWDESTDDLILGGASNMGIGVVAPLEKLHVQGDVGVGANGADSYIYFARDGGDTLGKIGRVAAGDLAIDAQGSTDIIFKDGGAENMRITDAGKVGIGTSSPACAINASFKVLEVSSSAGSAVRCTDTASSTNIEISAGSGATYIWNGTNTLMNFGTNNISRMTIAAAGEVTLAGDLHFSGANPEILGGDDDGAMFISADTSPVTGGTVVLYADNHASKASDWELRSANVPKLSFDTSAAKLVASVGVNVAGVIKSGSAGTNGHLQLGRTSDGATITNFITDGTNGIINSVAATIIQVNTSEKMRIDSAGNVGIGKTAGANSRLNVLGSATDGDFAILIEKASATATTSQVYVAFNNSSGGGNGKITGNGAGAAPVFAGYSDRRLKENIEPLPSQLENIMLLKPCEFDFKTGGHNIGFIAQEFQEVYPDAVAEGEPVTEGGEKMLTLHGWSKQEARLVSALQGAVEKINQLEERIAALEG
jgi:hypothetical protein